MRGEYLSIESCIAGARVVTDEMAFCSNFTSASTGVSTSIFEAGIRDGAKSAPTCRPALV